LFAAAFPKNREKQRRKRRGKRRRRREGREEEKLDAVGCEVEQERCWYLDIEPPPPYPEPRGGGGPPPPELRRPGAPIDSRDAAVLPALPRLISAPTRHGITCSLLSPTGEPEPKPPLQTSLLPA